MANELPAPENVNYELFQAQMELLEALLEPEDAPYPWNTAEPESEAYFADREQYFAMENWSEEETAAQTQTFFTQLDQLWSAATLAVPNTNTTDVAAVSAIQAILQRRFATRIPQKWLDAIAYHAHHVFSTQRTMAYQLVHCVQHLLPNWAEEELLVLACPFAYALRGTETAASKLVMDNFDQFSDWTALSEVEQARATLAIARYALDQLYNPESSQD
jgi:hypothetical protein